jgi:glycosyltransferase involved in cell wall biosynthesis
MPDEIRLVAYTDASTVGGAERCLATIMTGLPPSFRVTVVAADVTVAEVVAAGRAGAGTALVERPRSFWDPRTVVAQRRLLRRLRPHVCVVNLPTPYACLHGTIAALLVPGLRVVAVEHLPLPSRSRAARLLKRLASRRLAAHVAVSEHTAHAVAVDAELPGGRIVVVPNGVPEPATGTAELSLPRPVIGTLGRLDPQKGLDVLVDALALLPSVSAVVAGAGREQEALDRRAVSLSVADRFKIMGWQEEIGPLLRSLDVFVLPSRFEGLSLALLEAMAAGAAIVATDVGGTSEAVAADESALLVPPDDAPALAAAVRRLLDDRELRERLGTRAREVWLERFTAQRMQQAYADLLTGLVP